MAVSTIEGAGIGCFASERIEAGQLIWELDPIVDRIYNDANLESMDSLTRQFVKTYSYRHGGLYYLCVDNGRFFNHSESPNTRDPLDEYKTYALRDIEVGEEILSDYRTFGANSEDLTFNTRL